MITRANVKNFGQFWKNSPLAATYFFSPSGFGLQKGSGYFRSFGIAINQFQYGLTDHISIGMGAFLRPIAWPTAFSVKLSAPYAMGRASAAVTFGYLFKGSIAVEEGSDLDDPFIVYAVNSWGTRNHQLSVGTGYIFMKTQNGSQHFFHSVSYLFRPTGKWAFISENYLFRMPRGFTTPFSAGGRFYGRQFNFDLGLGVAYSFEIIGVNTFSEQKEHFAFPFPWFSLSLPFSKKVKSCHSIN